MLLLLACAAPQPVDSGAEDTLPASEPVYDVAGFEQALAQALSLGFPEPHSVHAAYLDRMGRGDGSCPDDPYNLTDSHVHGCTGSDGTFYMGVAEFIDQPGLRSLTGDALFRDPDGAELELGAGVVLSWTDTRQELVMMGSVRDEARSDWLSPGSSFILRAEAEEGVIRAEGGVGIGAESLDLRELSLSAGCLDGTLALRGPDLRWYVAELACGCGELAFQGQPLGATCPDPSPLIASLELAFGPLPELP